jgi:hypothetical protein
MYYLFELLVRGNGTQRHFAQRCAEELQANLKRPSETV